MTVETVSAIFGGLAIAALFGSIALAFAAETQRWRTWWAEPLSAIVALVATAGSLYYSERVGFVPCRLCWFQRIVMYPLAFILTLEVISRRSIPRIQPILGSLIGAGISAYHYRLQMLGADSTSCALDNPCSAKWVEVSNFLTLPAMAFCGFVAILVLNILAIRR